MFGSSPYDLAPASGDRFQGYASRAGSTDFAPYANVFSDVSNLYLPKTVKSQFRLCEYFVVMDGLVHSTIVKMATYPITELSYLSNNDYINKTYRFIFDEVFQIRAALAEVLMDYLTYGNAFVYVHHPLRKMLECPECHEVVPLESTDYIWSGYKFQFHCRKCSNMVQGIPRDQYIQSIRDLRMIRVNPNYMDIEHNPATGRTIYSYSIPPAVANAILIGRKDTLCTIPQPFINAAAQGRKLLFKPGSIFHLRRTSISRHDAGWGLPLITPVLKTLFHYRVLLKANESIALDQIVPMRIFFPQTSDPQANPYSTINLLDWQTHVKTEIGMWRRDPNYMPVMPYPVGHQVVGGQGKMLLLHNEIKTIQEQILAGLGCPSEFIFGGLRWTGASVSMRTLENTFLRLREDVKQLIEFLVRDISTSLSLPLCPVQQKPFRMADDLQKAAFDLQLVDRKMLSPATLMESRDFDYSQEQQKIFDSLEFTRKIGERQAMDNAEINGEAGVVSAKYQAEQQATLQKFMPQPPPQSGMPGQPGAPQGVPGAPTTDQFDLLGGEMAPEDYGMPPSPPEAPNALPPLPADKAGLALQLAQSILGLDSFDRPRALVRLREERPDVYPFVLDELNRLQVAKFSAKGA